MARSATSTRSPRCRKAFAIAIPHEQAMDVKDEVAFFQAVKARLAKFDSTGTGRTNEEIETTIRQVIDKALVSEQGDRCVRRGRHQEARYLDSFRRVPAGAEGHGAQKRRARSAKEAAERRDQGARQTNLVQSRTLMEMLEDAIKRYHNKILTAVEVMDELINISKEIVKSDKQAAEMG
jgi:type I restriction enzyme R subunit